MSILDISKEYRKALGLRILGTVICVVFSVIYHQFSHGVSSTYMKYMFVYPLVLEVFVYLVLVGVNKTNFFSPVWHSWYHWGVVTLVIGNALKGIFDIAGTSSPYVVGYWFVGSALIIISVVGSVIYKR